MTISNACTDLVDLNVEYGRGEKIAFIDPEHPLTYAQLQAKTGRYANLLGHPDRPGDVVYGTSGKPVPRYDVRPTDEAGADVADGQIGELFERGPSAAEGYWNQRDKSGGTLHGERTRSGNKYTREASESCTYCGRTDDMFKASGIWVSPF
jgi:acyl-coenzyme A synthetase/AMP-(fatty) acid ligase